MSEGDNQATGILLPSASVAVFSRDPETLRAARVLADDWRFARVRVQIAEGDATAAARAFSDVPSPNLLIVQTDVIDDSFTRQLEDLAGSCDEGTAAIIIGPVNDVYLYRKLIDMGVSDYLVRPVSNVVMADVIAKTLIDKIGVSGSRLVAFIGAKGGVGASALAQAMAWGVADILGEKVMMIDPSGGWSTMSVGLGFEPITTLAEAARAAASRDDERIKRMIFSASDKFSVLASGGDPLLETNISADQLETLLDVLLAKYPVMIADLSHTDAALAGAVLRRAHQIIVVSTPTLSSLRHARSLIQELKEHKGNSDTGIHMLINMQGAAPGSEVPRQDIEKALGMRSAAIIPYAPKIFLAQESEGQKLTQSPEGREIVKKSLLPLVQKTLGVGRIEESEPEQKTGMLTGFLNKLTVKG